MQLIAAHLCDEPRPIRSLRPDIPEAIETLLLEVLGKAPADRPQSAIDLKLRLREALEIQRDSRPRRADTVKELEKKTNLSTPTTSFIGREADLNALDRLFKEGHRLVTLHGPAGMGKTRLARHFGLSYIDEYATEGGVWFCDLTAAISLDGIYLDVARAMDIQLGTEGVESTPVTCLGRAIAVRGKMFLIIDNFEQVVEHGQETIGKWLEMAPEARFLVT
jgi:hypothetical protein